MDDCGQSDITKGNRMGYAGLKVNQRKKNSHVLFPGKWLAWFQFIYQQRTQLFQSFARTWLLPVITVLLIILLLFQHGPSFPYRVGEKLNFDLRSHVDLQVYEPELSQDENGTTLVQFQDKLYPAGTLLAKQGERLTPRKCLLLQQEFREYQAQEPLPHQISQFGGLMILILTFASILAVYINRFQPSMLRQKHFRVKICTLLLISMAANTWLDDLAINASIVSLTLMGMILTLIYNPQFALLTSFLMIVSIDLGTAQGLGSLLIHVGGSATAILILGEIRTRTRPVMVSLYSGMMYAAMTFTSAVLLDYHPGTIGLEMICNSSWSILAGLILSGTLPWVERYFHVLTDAGLLEWADSSNPLLQELVQRAPGTYTHSLTVAVLAEAAAEAIGARALLARVASYYHDVGKLQNPLYFIENQLHENRHRYLEPALSAKVIIAHVRDGVQLGRQYGVPSIIIDLIEQHHGTTLVEYFYSQAKQKQNELGVANVALEHQFRYPGPKPQCKEAAILMLADAVESASRALLHPTYPSLQKLVHSIVMKRLIDHQLECSGLTFTELQIIEEKLVKAIHSVYHRRIREVRDAPIEINNGHTEMPAENPTEKPSNSLKIA